MAHIPREILLVDSNPEDGNAMWEFLKNLRPNWIPVLVDSIAAAKEVLQKQSFEIVVTEYLLNDGTAFDLIPILGQIPALIVTAHGGEDIAIQSLHHGAYDYLVKDPQRIYLASLPSTMSNVMARKEAEAALIQSEARYMDLYDNAPDIYFQVSPDGSIISVNRQGASQLGYTVKELLNNPIWTLIHPDDLEEVKGHFQRVMQDPKEIHRIEFRQITKKNETIYSGASLSVVVESDGDKNIRILCRDVTAQKKAEDYANNLQQKLARKKRMESMGLLAGGVAHDLNNILGPMAAYPDLLIEGLQDREDLIPIIKDIRLSANQAIAIIRDLLTMARQGRHETAPMNLNDAIQEYLQSSTHRELAASQTNVETEIHLDRELPSINGSNVNIGKVLLNLTINAFESMPQGGKLRIETFSLDVQSPLMGYERIPIGHYAAIRISDQGGGIGKEDQERMFEPFFSKKLIGRSGTGLGLAVVYGVVKDHKGFIDVSSRIDKGTSITVYLPTTSDPAEKPAPQEKSPLSGTESLLVVDDMPQQRDMALKLLERMGYQVDTAIHGHDAIERIKAHHADHPDATQAYDLVLLDMIMEDQFDGLDTLKEILKIYPNQKCIIVSGYAETSRVREAQALGALQYLPKPYSREELGTAVRSAIGAEQDESFQLSRQR